MKRSPAIPLLVLLLLLPAAALAAPPRALPTIRYNRDVRPILAENCFACHGFDAGKRKAGLRLDTQEGAFGDLGGYAAVVEGQPKDSELWKRVTSKDPDDVMPPPSTGKKLTAAEVETLRRWIELGAGYEPHWAYVAPARPPVPAVGDQAWARNPIDRFVLARLEREGLRPSPEAARHTLLRRLSFDLTGLPPSPEEVEAFQRDARPEAYDEAVDRLLASPHFGERMAVHWLDVVRYADSIGYHSDNGRNVSLYRDWVIRAFNDGMPFDRFTTEQLAGDLLPRPTLEQRIASGYNRLLQTTEEGGAQPKEYAQKYLADRVRNASAAWMASTMGCAQCHDHKYDPFSLRDFYRFAAFFADIEEKPVGRREQGLLPGPDQAAALKKLDDALQALKDRQTQPPRKLERALAVAQRAWERRVARLAPPRWTPLETSDERGASAGGAFLLFMSNEDSFEVSGPAPERDIYTVTMNVEGKGITGFRLEAMTQRDQPWIGPGRAPGGGFAITALRLADGDGAEIPIARATASAGTVKRGRALGWTVPAGAREHERLVLQTARPLDLPEGGKVTFVIEQSAPGGRTLGRFRLSSTTSARVDTGKGREPPRDVIAAAGKPRKERSEAEEKALTAFYRTVAPALARDRARQLVLEREKEALIAQIPKSLTVKRVEPQVVRVLPRGDWMIETGEVVTPAVPAFLPGIALSEGQRATRLDLARWLTSAENPLTARVLVNRLWKLFFGQGLSKTLEDFGAQGELPSHPELLDWLAVELREGGWDVKKMIRLLVTSAAYRQASRATREHLDRDPYNRLLARQSRFRLDAEFVRDNALAVSGLLAAKVGGPSVKPYQPPGYWAYLNFPPREWIADTGEAQYRRGLYTWWQRAFLHPSLLAFDAPSREECTAERTRSNIPQQALVLLNDPTYVEAARVFAARVLERGGPDFSARLRWAYLRALSRPPSAAEEKALRTLHDRHLAEQQAAPDAARALTTVGFAPAARGLDVAEHAAWTSVARAILNAHETITRP